MSSTDHIHIEPVNSKGEFTNCVMGIPYKDIPKVVDMLNEFYYNLPKILR